MIDSDEPIIASRQCLNYDFKKWAGEKADKIRIAATGDIPFNLSLLAKENVGSFLCFDKIINTSEESPLCYIPLEPPMISPMYNTTKSQLEAVLLFFFLVLYKFVKTDYLHNIRIVLFSVSDLLRFDYLKLYEQTDCCSESEKRHLK